MGYLLKKIDETGDVKRREGSGRPKSSRTENNINAVKELISSQEDKPGTHATSNKISKMMDYSTYFDQKNNCRRAPTTKFRHFYDNMNIHIAACKLFMHLILQMLINLIITNYLERENSQFKHCIILKKAA